VIRTAHEIACRALVHGALGFRASLEMTRHPKCDQACLSLLPWLQEVGLASSITDFQREILNCHHGKLSLEAQTEAFWRGESAALLAWSIQLFDSLDPVATVDPNSLVDCLRILKPEAGELIEGASLRPSHELQSFCIFCIAVRNRFQLAQLGARNRLLFDAICKTRLEELGLHRDNEAWERILEETTQFAAVTPNSKGLYVVRALAAEWLLGGED